LSICAICLGRHKHNVYQCAVTRTWDNKHDVHAFRKGSGVFAKRDNKQLCTSWQRPESCSLSHHPLHHCS
ncbi:hypothetical protein PAXRUDRAFT_37402, partial [Paxillus rubicundulus Ve08.2h10]